MLSPAEAIAILSEDPFIPFEQQPLEVQLVLMGEWGCELDEISAETGISEEQLRTVYAPLIMKGRAKGLRAIRQAQHHTATTEGKPLMLKHLGQHRLKQIDELVVTTANKGLDLLSGVDIKQIPKETLIAMLEAKLAALKNETTEQPKDSHE